ncbi:hypothetical protein SSCG_00466 [Streptomyces clavuligerus]|nr:hypothetical protein SSCG_00466 [Streptomyces clavuligerus]
MSPRSGAGRRTGRARVTGARRVWTTGAGPDRRSPAGPARTGRVRGQDQAPAAAARRA